MAANSLPAHAYTTLGRTGRRVSRVGFGGYRVADGIATHRAALERALAGGVTLVDTSTNYGDGESERLVGRVLRATGRADAAVVVTKAGYVQGSNQEEALRRIREGRPWSEMTEYAPDCWHCLSPDFLRDQLTASLARLGRSRVDVLLLHNPEYVLMDAAHRGVPVDEARGIFYDRIRRALVHLEAERVAGRIAWYGLSSNTLVVPRERADAVDLGRVLAAAGEGFAVVQLPLNPLELGAAAIHHTGDDKSVLDVARAAGLGVLANRPFNAISPQGMVRFAPLAGDVLRSLGGSADREAARIARLDAHLTATFGDVGRGTTSQRTLRALLTVPGVDVVLVGMRRPEYVDDVLGAFF